MPRNCRGREQPAEDEVTGALGPARAGSFRPDLQAHCGHGGGKPVIRVLIAEDLHILRDTLVTVLSMEPDVHSLSAAG
jgi:hypothetical protein